MGNTHRAEGIRARRGAPGAAAHGQILALLAVAAAFREARWRHNLGEGTDYQVREVPGQQGHPNIAQFPPYPKPPPASPGEGGGFAEVTQGGLLVAQDPPGLPRALAPDSGRVERAAEKVIGRKERNKETKVRMEAQQAQRLSVVREREQRVGDPQRGVGEAGRRQAQTWRDSSRDQRGEIEEEGGQAEPEVQWEQRGLRPERGVPGG